MTRTALLAVACLAGCAGDYSGYHSDPQPIVDAGNRYEFTTGLTPFRLAHCTAVNAATMAGPYRSEVEPLVRPDNYAVVVRRSEWVGKPFIVARALPDANGSRLEVFMSADLGRASEADWLARLRKGCDAVRAAGAVQPVNLRVVPAPETPPPPARPRPTRG